MGAGKKSESKKEEILQSAKRLFLTNGYEKTSMRQIAGEVQVSLGLAAYHFNSKREIALEIVRRIFHRLAGYTKMYVGRHNDPLVYSSALITLNYRVLSSEPYRNFYEDILREDILMDAIVESGVETYFRVRDKYCPEMSDEEAERLGWYGNYVSVSMERSLVLYGSERPMIPGSIPEIIVKSTLGIWHFEDAEKLVSEAFEKSQEVVNRILREQGKIVL